MTNIVILSPHFDDAIFSCWHLAKQPGVEIITIFGGIPPNNISTLWDRLCGEPNSAKMMHKRLLENETVFKKLGLVNYNLDYLDIQYKPAKRDIQKIADSIVSRVSPKSHFFVPLAGSRIWQHPDHITIRKVGELLSKQGRKVSFYVDIPYMQMPSNPNKRCKNRMIKRASTLLGTKIAIDIYELNRQDQLLKQGFMLQYKSQYKMTNLASFNTLRRKANLEHEVVFNQVSQNT